jgi:hypothetical protein
VELFVPVERRESLRREASYMQVGLGRSPHTSTVRTEALSVICSKELQVRGVDVQWIQVLAEGWASPLRGFMRSHEYLQSLHYNCVISPGGDGFRCPGQLINHSVPITMSVCCSTWQT